MEVRPRASPMPHHPTNRIALVAVLVLGLALIGVSFWRALRGIGAESKSITPTVMGTTSRLWALGPSGRPWPALQEARAELDAVNRLMSTYDPSSELSRFNAAPAGQDVPLSPATLEVMRFGQELAERTGGAFDITMRPLGVLWSEAGKAGRVPDDSAIVEMLRRVGYRRLQVGEKSARKRVDGLEVSLDAIAKGYAVDHAIGRLRGARLAGGLVEVGGDLACFGAGPQVVVQSPWDESARLMRLRVLNLDRGLAVCTSGNYRRFVTIGQRRYSHIIDPRTGRPADAVPSVTVIAPDTMTADGWATALSVLDIETGRKLIASEPGVEAMWVTGSPDAPRFHYTPGFRRYVAE